jgi:hypothetical protein
MNKNTFTTVNTLWGKESVLEVKTCIKCHEVKPLTAFMTRENLKSGKSSYRTECKKCAKEKGILRKALEKQHPRPTSANYCCPICNKTEKELKNNGRWSDRNVWCLDHDHNTLEFRGWICNNCNIAIGRFEDNPSIVLKAYDYLDNK